MGKKSMQNTLTEILRNGERVQWEGKTEPFPLLANDAKGQILGKWIGTWIAAVAILVLYIRNIGDNSVEVAGAILLVTAALLLSPAIERRCILGQHYWITNQRVIFIAENQTVYDMELSEIDDYQVISGKTEYDSLVLGSCVFEDVKRQLRWRACHPKTDSQSTSTNGQAYGMALFNLKECSVAEELLMENVEPV